MDIIRSLIRTTDSEAALTVLEMNNEGMSDVNQDVPLHLGSHSVTDCGVQHS